MSTTFAVISDTHGRLDYPVIDLIDECDGVIHAGDFDNENTYNKIELLCDDKPYYRVRGNNDFFRVFDLEDELFFKIENVEIYLTHIPIYLPRDLGNANLVICGHMHRFCFDNLNSVPYIKGSFPSDIKYLNPGSVSYPRGGENKSAAKLTISGERFTVEKINLD